MGNLGGPNCVFPGGGHGRRKNADNEVGSFEHVIRKWLRIGVGLVLVLVGIIGLVLPIMPGWVFLIPGLVILAGRFEGVDQRVIDARGFEEVSVGDAVLAGGEAAAMVAIEACVRLVPGVLGQAESLSEESFEDGLLELI